MSYTIHKCSDSIALQSACFLNLSCLSYCGTAEFCLVDKRWTWKKTRDLCKLHFGVNKSSKRALHKQIALLSAAESTKTWLPPSYPKAPFIIGAFSELIWNSRMEIPHLGLLYLPECTHKGAQGAIVPALLVVSALLKWQIKTCFFVMHCTYLSFDQRQNAWNYTF